MPKADSKINLPRISGVQETDWAYLAGLIDGDGSLSIHRNSSKSKTRTYVEGWRRQHILCIGGLSRVLLDGVQKRVNLGKINTYSYTNKPPKSYRIVVHFLRFASNEIRVILPKIIPYLILKKEIAEIMLKSLDTIECYHEVDRKDVLKSIDKEFHYAFLRTKNNEPYSNNHKYWNERRQKEGRPPTVTLLD